jgi:hypothetical protein
MPFGNVVDAGIKKKEDGTNRNFGFVVMASEPEGLNAMNQMNGKHIGGKQLKVVPAERRADDPELAAAQAGMTGMPGGAMMMPGMPGMPGADPLAGVPGMDNMAMVQMQMQALQLQQTMLMQAAMLQPGTSPGTLPGGAGAGQNPLLLQAGMMNPLLGQIPGGLGTAPGIGMPGKPGMPIGLPGMPMGLPMGLPGLPGMGLAGAPEYEGTLKSVSAKNGYGFLDCPETFNLYQRDVYVDKERLPLDASQGDRFRFTVEMSEKGQPKAGNLMKV